MNKQILQQLAKDWVDLASNDIREKLTSFLEENNTNVEEFAQVVGLPIEDIYGIIDGNGDTTLLTFASLMIAFGKVLKVEDTIEPQVCPRRDEDEETPQPRRTPRENVFTRHHVQRPLDFEERERRIPPLHRSFRDMVDEDFCIPRPRRMVQSQRPQRPTSKFSNMERCQLVDIINRNLWDSEIDVRRSSYNDLVAFLDEKDRRIKELQSRSNTEREEITEDPKVTEFKKKARKAISQNPQLMDLIKNILKDI